MSLIGISLIKEGLDDVRAGLRGWRLAWTLGLQDVKQRYQRSKIGAFWLTINTAVLIGAMGVIFGTLFKVPMDEFLPFVGLGLIFWGFISQTITDGCNAFSDNSGMILQIKLPYSTYVIRILVRNGLIFAHTILIYPLLMLVFFQWPGFGALWAILGFVLIVANVTWMILIAAIICARFRDMGQVILNTLQVLFYATPIVWTSERLPDGWVRDVLALNPFLHLLQILRAPLLGDPTSALNWYAAVGLAIVGWLLALLLLGMTKLRIAYWL